MNPEEAKALEGLLEIGLPPPVSYAPETAGWWILLAALLLAALLLAWRWRRSWTANRYRREALAELAALEAGPGGAALLPELVKRTALAAAPREKVAALSGEKWLRYLDETEGSAEFTTGPGRLLTELAYGSGGVPDKEMSALYGTVRRWIRRHNARI